MKFLKVVKTVFNIIVTVVLFLVITVNVVMLISSFVKKENPPTFLGFSVLKVTGNSMEPNLMYGDVIIIKKFENYQLYDVVTYKYKDTLITHRIVEIVEGGYITKGEANITDDGFVAKNDVCGKVVQKIDNAIVSKIMSPWFMAGTFVVIIIFALINTRFRKRKQKKI